MKKINSEDQTKPLNVTENRNANYDLLDIVKKFKPTGINRMEGTCANIKDLVEPWDAYTYDFDETLCGMVSAPYILSRLCALFEGLKIDVGGQRDYKITWCTVLEHKESGFVVTFYDHKGGISYGSDIYGDKTPDSFIKDLQQLIEVLKNDNCPHPYDGCVVGEIA